MLYLFAMVAFCAELRDGAGSEGSDERQMRDL